MDHVNTQKGSTDDVGTRRPRARILYLDDARRQRELADKSRLAGPCHEFEPVPELELERMSAEAQELFCYKVNRYARTLLDSARQACNSHTIDAASIARASLANDPIAPPRLPEPRRRDVERWRSILLDFLQVTGAAAFGALAVLPVALGGFGELPLALAATLTVAAMLLKPRRR